MPQIRLVNDTPYFLHVYIRSAFGEYAVDLFPEESTILTFRKGKKVLMAFRDDDAGTLYRLRTPNVTASKKFNLSGVAYDLTGDLGEEDPELADVESEGDY